jgi:hypothetical protein
MKEPDRSELRVSLLERGRGLWRLRMRVVAVSLACLILFFGVLTIRMAVGDDPAVGTGTGSSSGRSEASASSETAGGSLAGESFGPPEGSSSEVAPLFDEAEGEGQVEPDTVHSGQS